MKFSARTWKFPDNINTDLILPNIAFRVPEKERNKMCFHANRPGWTDLVQPGDIIMWDNQTMQHNALADYDLDNLDAPENHRLMFRSTLA